MKFYIQVMKKRSFFVYETDVRLLRAVEGRLARDRRAKLPSPRRFLFGPARTNSLNSDVNSSAMSASYEEAGSAPIVSMRRPRASTSPLLPSLVDDHQVWFDYPRFDGSFPSRVLPFLYLGNLCVSPLHSHIKFLMSSRCAEITQRMRICSTHSVSPMWSRSENVHLFPHPLIPLPGRPLLPAQQKCLVPSQRVKDQTGGAAYSSRSAKAA
jgi:hypothetical protein